MSDLSNGDLLVYMTGGIAAFIFAVAYYSAWQDKKDKANKADNQ